MYTSLKRYEHKAMSNSQPKLFVIQVDVVLVKTKSRIKTIIELDKPILKFL